MTAASLSGGDHELLVSAATAAPSIFNTQPWAFRLWPDGVDLHADPTRQLTHTDPSGRSLHISCGAALLDLRLAVQHLGREPVVRLFPEPEQPTLLARVRAGEARRPDAVVEQLYAAIPRRHTNREPYEERPVPDSDLEALAEAAGVEGAFLGYAGSEQERIRLARLVHDADREIAADQELTGETRRWTTDDPARLEGVPVRSFGPVSRAAAPLRDFALGRPVEGRETGRFEAAPTVAVLSTAGDEPADWLRAGQALQRLLLTATCRGLAASFANQPIERPGLRWLVRDPSSGVRAPQMLIRIGYGPPVPGTARRPASEVTLTRQGDGP
jgi:nitroreductase